MRTSSPIHKIRPLVKEKERTTWGVTIPPIFKNWYNVFVNIKEENGCLILESGTQPKSFNHKEIVFMSKKLEVVKLNG